MFPGPVACTVNPLVMAIPSSPHIMCCSLACCSSTLLGLRQVACHYRAVPLFLSVSRPPRLRIGPSSLTHFTITAVSTAALAVLHQFVFAPLHFFAIVMLLAVGKLAALSTAPGPVGPLRSVWLEHRNCFLLWLRAFLFLLYVFWPCVFSFAFISQHDSEFWWLLRQSHPSVRQYTHPMTSSWPSSHFISFQASSGPPPWTSARPEPPAAMPLCWQRSSAGSQLWPCCM